MIHRQLKVLQVDYLSVRAQVPTLRGSNFDELSIETARTSGTGDKSWQNKKLYTAVKLSLRSPGRQHKRRLSTQQNASVHRHQHIL